MRSRAQEQLSSKKSAIDKLYQDIAEHKHDLLLLQKQTDDVQKQQESLEEYLKAPPPTAHFHTHRHLALARCTGTLHWHIAAP